MIAVTVYSVSISSNIKYMKKHNTSYAHLGDFAPKVTSPNKTLMALGMVAVVTIGVLALISIGQFIMYVVEAW